MGNDDHSAWLKDYKRLTELCSIIELENWTTIAVAGKDRIGFLQNLCTQDIRQMKVGTARETFFTDVKGKIVTHGWIFAEPESYSLLTVPNQGQKILAHLDRYIIREDVQLADRSSDCRWQLASGAQSSPFFQGSEHYSQAALLNMFGTDRLLLRSSASALSELPACSWSSPAATALRLEAAVPLFEVDFDGTNLPQEIDRDSQAISFHKGCYLGQETIARIDALGHVNKKLVIVKSTNDSDTLSPGEELQVDGVGVGEVRSVAWSPKTGVNIAFAFVRRGFNTPGTCLKSTKSSVEVMPRSL